MEDRKKYYIIKNWIIKEIDEKLFDDKDYKDDYKLLSANDDIKIIDYDKRNIRPYAKELLNSMNELTEVKILKMNRILIFILILITWYILYKMPTIKEIKTTVEQISWTKTNNNGGVIWWLLPKLPQKEIKTPDVVDSTNITDVKKNPNAWIKHNIE